MDFRVAKSYICRILLVLLLSFFLFSCGVSITALKLRFHGQNVSAHFELQGLDGYLSTNLQEQKQFIFSDSVLLPYKKVCQDNLIRQTYEVSNEGKHLTCDLFVDGFDKANALMLDLKKMYFRYKFFTYGRAHVINMKIPSYIFSPNGNFSFETDQNIQFLSPGYSASDFKIVNRTKNSVDYEVNPNHNSPDETFSFFYADKPLPPNHKGPTNELSWLTPLDANKLTLLCSLLGGIVSFVTIKNYFKSKS